MRNLQVIEPLSKNEHIALELTKCWIEKREHYTSVDDMVNIYNETLRKLYAKENNYD